MLAWIASLFVNLSPSLPLGLYRAIPGPPTRGAIVVVCLPAPLGAFARARGYLGRGPCPAGAERLGKIVAGLPGDTIDADTAGITINGAVVPGSRRVDRDTRGRPLGLLWRPPVVVPPGDVFLLATRHPRSFDGRYFGPTPAAGAVVVVPVMRAR